MALGGLATPLLVAWIGTENLLLVAGAGLVGCLMCVTVIDREQGGRLARRASADAELVRTGLSLLPATDTRFGFFCLPRSGSLQAD